MTAYKIQLRCPGCEGCQVLSWTIEMLAEMAEEGIIDEEQMEAVANLEGVIAICHRGLIFYQI